ncbi:hypothetical protein LTR56_000161 [Elasticomyces elasticus]|nr:hypothetical protein LTR56_000161 [Elasticomyces elasticus]KAK3667149.1 hypothetical protein LTR22_002014 [Elasticomyces elasticus]KAK4932923.1 hypothetical protein LTR49_000880 [Elasticomyces elasticus]KAK5768672.1 hypothetical protein LTS12_001097 [Elasticomyces elasticus]
MSAQQRRFTTSLAPSEQSAANELPFEQLSRLLARFKLGSEAESTPWSAAPAVDHSPTSGENALNQNSSLASPSRIHASLSQDLALKFNDQMLPHLQAFFPNSAVNDPMLEASEDAGDLNRYSAAQVQFLIYAATNNLPGISQRMSLTSIYEYLRDPVRLYLASDMNQLSMRTMTPLLPCTKPMAETMFRCAIEAGDCELIQQLLNRQELGLDVNNQICTIDDEPLTPVERSAALDHARMVRVLINMGADVNKTHRNIDHGLALEGNYVYVYGMNGAPEPRGALEQAIDMRLQSTSASLETIELLLQAGGDFHARFLNALLGNDDVQAANLLISARFYVAYGLWLIHGCFHGAIHTLDQKSVMDICDKLQHVRLDVNHYLVRNEQDYDVWRSPLTPRRLIDVAIERGFVEVVGRLQGLGALFTTESMTAAVQSCDLTLVQHILSLGAVADCYSAHFRTTAIAEAFRLSQREVYQLLVGEGCMRNIHEEYHFCSMLGSAAEVGDAEMVDFLLSLDTPHHENRNILGDALLQAADANHTDIAIRLVEAGAAVDTPACSHVLGHEYSSNSWRPSPATFAAKHQNMELFDVLFEHGPAFDVDIFFATRAVEYGNISILDRLVDTGEGMIDACKCAVSTGNLAIMRHLYSRGATMSYWPDYGGNLLVTAVANADIVMALELISYGMEPSPDALVAAVLTTPTLLEPLLQQHLDAGRGRPFRASIVTAPAHFFPDSDVPILKNLLDPRCAIRWITPLGAAILKKNGKGHGILRRLLATAPNLDRPAIAHGSEMHNVRGGIVVLETELLLAVGTCEPTTVLLLLQHGADVNLPARRGLRRTPLQKAAEVGSWPVVELLLDHGADAKAPTAERNGGTALQLAAKGGYIGIAELLLDAGADIQAVGSKVHGRTALESAAEHGRYDMLKFPTLRTKHSDAQFDKAVMYAREKSHNAVADLLLTIRAEQRTQVLAIRHHSCDDCGAPFSNAFTLKRHQRTAHGDVVEGRRHACRFCCRMFKRKDMMDRHVAVHEGTRVECPHCTKDFSRGDSLSNHRRHCWGS